MKTNTFIAVFLLFILVVSVSFAQEPNDKGTTYAKKGKKIYDITNYPSVKRTCTTGCHYSPSQPDPNTCLGKKKTVRAVMVLGPTTIEENGKYDLNKAKESLKSMGVDEKNIFSYFYSSADDTKAAHDFYEKLHNLRNEVTECDVTMIVADGHGSIFDLTLTKTKPYLDLNVNRIQQELKNLPGYKIAVLQSCNSGSVAKKVVEADNFQKTIVIASTPGRTEGTEPCLVGGTDKDFIPSFFSNLKNSRCNVMDAWTKSYIWSFTKNSPFQFGWSYYHQTSDVPCSFKICE